MFWSPKYLSVDIMIKSIKALSPSGSSPYSSFITFLELLGPSLPTWLQLVIDDLARFSCSAYRFQHIELQFPCLKTGAAPDAIICSSSFAPLMDMGYLYPWRLLLDRILSSTASLDISCIRLFLSRAGACLHDDTYLELELLHHKAHTYHDSSFQHPRWLAYSLPIPFL